MSFGLWPPLATMKKESFVDELSKRLSEAVASPEMNNNNLGQNKEPVWQEAGTGMNVDQLRIGEFPF